MKKYSDVISGAILFILSTAYYVMALDIKKFNAGQTGIVTSDFMPKIYGAAVMLLSALLIVRGIRNIKKAAGPEDEVETGGRKFFVQPETLLVFLRLCSAAAHSGLHHHVHPVRDGALLPPPSKGEARTQDVSGNPGSGNCIHSGHHADLC